MLRRRPRIKPYGARPCADSLESGGAAARLRRRPQASWSCLGPLTDYQADRGSSERLLTVLLSY